MLDASGLAAAAGPEPLLVPELVLALVAGVGGTLAWRYVTREQARSLEAQPAAPLATPPPPPLPANPGLVPPPKLPDRPAGAGTPQAPPVPELPGLPQAGPVPHLLSTPASDQDGPAILHTDRNKGLKGGARTNSRRARKAARVADPDVTQALKNAE